MGSGCSGNLLFDLIDTLRIFIKRSRIHCGNETRTQKVTFGRFSPQVTTLRKCWGLFLKMPNLHLILTSETDRLAKIKKTKKKKPSKVYQFVTRPRIENVQTLLAIILQINASRIEIIKAVSRNGCSIN